MKFSFKDNTSRPDSRLERDAVREGRMLGIRTLLRSFHRSRIIVALFASRILIDHLRLDQLSA